MNNVTFHGEVPAANLITGDTLASQIGLTAGTSQYSSEPWLKFTMDGKEVFVAKKPLRHSISWDDIHAVGAVFGTCTVTINGSTYKVRLMTGGNANPTTGGTYYGNNTTEHQGSEWNRLMYSVHSTTHTNTSNNVANSSGVGTLAVTNGTQAIANYTDADLLTHYTSGSGTYNWCQETSGHSSTTRVLRGYGGVASGSYDTSSNAFSYVGWRPVLELIGPQTDSDTQVIKYLPETPHKDIVDALMAYLDCDYDSGKDVYLILRELAPVYKK